MLAVCWAQTTAKHREKASASQLARRCTWVWPACTDGTAPGLSCTVSPAKPPIVISPLALLLWAWLADGVASRPSWDPPGLDDWSCGSWRRLLA